MKIRAAVAHAPHEPFELVDCELAGPGEGEVLVRVKACGICHTDLAVKGRATPPSRVLGHEGAGVVEEVGRGVVNVAAGDHVVMSYAACGACGNCRTGHPSYCDQFYFINMHDTHTPLAWKGRPLTGRFFAQSSFATHAIATSGNVVKIDKALPMHLMAPLGCGFLTGMGSVMQVLAPSAGDAFAVFGAGSVGLSALLAAKIVGCTPLIAVDVKASRLQAALALGATHVVNASKEDAVERIRAIAGSGVHCALDTTGVPAVAEQAMRGLRSRGVAAYVAAAGAEARLSVNLRELLGSGRTLRGVVEGDAVPADFIPRMIGFYAKGLFPLEKLVSPYPFERINQAVEDTESGKVVKAVLVMD